MVSELSQKIFRTVDAMDADGFGALFRPDGRCVFGNNDPLEGPEAVAQGSAGFLASLAGIKHDVTREWTVGVDAIVEAAVSYDRHDGKTVTIPVVTVYSVASDGLISDYRVFFDLAPVYA